MEWGLYLTAIDTEEIHTLLITQIHFRYLYQKNNIHNIASDSATKAFFAVLFVIQNVDMTLDVHQQEGVRIRPICTLCNYGDVIVGASQRRDFQNVLVTWKTNQFLKVCTILYIQVSS